MRPNVSPPTIVECGAADGAALEQMSSSTSSCSSECVQFTCAKDSAKPTDQCLSIFLLYFRYDSDEDRHATYLFNFQARRACQIHAQQQRKLLQHYRSVYTCIWKPQSAWCMSASCVVSAASLRQRTLHLHVPASVSTLLSYLVAHRACLLTLLMGADIFLMHVTGSNKKHSTC